MSRRTYVIALGALLVAQALLLPVAALAANAPEQELDEVLVNGNRIKATRDPQKIVNWLKLLVGQFRYDGRVELKGEGAIKNRVPVRGVADCTAFGLAPGVSCVINVIWPEVREQNGDEVPGGISTLSPAMIQYGLDPDHLGIRFLQVDNKGHGDYGQGYLVGSTLTTTTPCTDLPGDCKRVSQITAQPDGKTVEMQIDIEQDQERLIRYKFMLMRVGAVPAGAISGGAP